MLWAKKIKINISAPNGEKTKMLSGECSGEKQKARQCSAQNCTSPSNIFFPFPSLFKNVHAVYILNHENIMRYTINVVHYLGLFKLDCTPIGSCDEFSFQV